MTRFFSSLNISQFNLVNAGSALTALAFTAADKRIGWKSNSRKVLIFGTTNLDSYHHWFKDDHRKEPLGDGNDNCKTHRPPGLTNFGNIIKNNGIQKIIGYIGSFNASINTANYFDSYLYTAFNRNRSFYTLHRCPPTGETGNWGDIITFLACTKKQITSKFIHEQILQFIPTHCF